MTERNIVSEYYDNKITDKPILKDAKMLGSGSFGNVYTVYDNNKNKIALKVENITSNVKQLLLKEFKICFKFYVIKIKIKKIMSLNNSETNSSIYKKNAKIIEELDKDDILKVYNYIINNNLLNIPSEFNIDYMYKNNCIAKAISYYSCSDYNFLSMKLYGKNLEYITDNYYLTEKAKYFLAYRLLHTMSCVHRCGVVHRDVKLANFVLNDDCDIDNKDKIKTLYPTIIDMGLATDYYKCSNNSVIQIPCKKTHKLAGTLRYISLNIHMYNSPTIIDDLISLCFILVIIFTNNDLPWMGHLKDTEDNTFDIKKHTKTKCKCGYHNNIIKKKTRKRNTIAEVKYHVPFKSLSTDKYPFLAKWLKYLHSLNLKQMPSYNYLFKLLDSEIKENIENYKNIEDLHFEILKNKIK
jgi:serine/threonine protein kinase